MEGRKEGTKIGLQKREQEVDGMEGRGNIKKQKEERRFERKERQQGMKERKYFGCDQGSYGRKVSR